MPSTFKLAQFGETYDCYLTRNNYRNGKTAVQVLSYDSDCRSYVPHATVSVNLNDEWMHDIGPGEFVFKDYSENEGLLEQFIALGLVETTDKAKVIGHAGECPVVRLTERSKQFTDE